MLTSNRHIKRMISVVQAVCLLLAFECLWGAHPARADIYKYIEDGVVHYTNQPPTDTQHTEVVATTTSHAAAAPRRSAQKKPSQVSSSRTIPHLHIIQRVAATYELSPELIKAIVKVESNYNSKAVSPKGAQGLMQLMPATAKRFGVSNSFDPEENITGGVKFLRHLFKQFGEHNLDLVLAGYNAGEEAVRRYGNKVPPYRETQQYVKKVKALYLQSAGYTAATTAKIYRYRNQDGVLTFTNVPRVN